MPLPFAWRSGSDALSSIPDANASRRRADRQSPVRTEGEPRHRSEGFAAPPAHDLGIFRRQVPDAEEVVAACREQALAARIECELKDELPRAHKLCFHVVIFGIDDMNGR